MSALPGSSSPLMLRTGPGNSLKSAVLPARVAESGAIWRRSGEDQSSPLASSFQLLASQGEVSTVGVRASGFLARHLGSSPAAQVNSQIFPGRTTSAVAPLSV